MVSTGIKGGAPRTANGRIWGVRSAFARSSISRFSEARFFAAISRVSIAAGARPLVVMPGAGKFVESLILIKKSYRAAPSAAICKFVATVDGRSLYWACWPVMGPVLGPVLGAAIDAVDAAAMLIRALGFFP
jgi:hypothetical protein